MAYGTGEKTLSQFSLAVVDGEKVFFLGSFIRTSSSRIMPPSAADHSSFWQVALHTSFFRHGHCTSPHAMEWTSTTVPSPVRMSRLVSPFSRHFLAKPDWTVRTSTKNTTTATRPPVVPPSDTRGGNIPTRKTRVTFNSERTIRYVMPVAEYYEREINATWYSKMEIRAMRQRCKADAMELSPHRYQERGASHESTSLTDATNGQDEGHLIPQRQPLYQQNDDLKTDRGLETKTSIGAARRKRHRMHGLNAVFVEQQRQKSLGIKDEEALADAYFEVSEPCHVAANMMGMRDARDVLVAAHQHQLDKENCICRCVSPVSVDMLGVD